MINQTLDNEIYALLAKGIRLVQANYERTAEFFMNSNNFVFYLDEMKVNQVKVGIVTSLNLQCTGHGSFAPHKVAARFLENLQQITENNHEIKRIKIKLSGFDLGKELVIKGMRMNQRKPTFVEELARLLSDKMRTLTSLQIRICNMKNCRADDFRSIMELGMNVQAKQLTNLSCEFSDWAFAKLQTDKQQDVTHIYSKCSGKADHDRHYQPNIDDFMNMLQGSFQKTMGQPLLQLKKFRLQISTWYYTDYEVEKFFHNAKLAGIQNLPKQDKIPSRIQYFHNEFRKRVEMLIRDLMVDLTNMEVDLRNWNKKFQMGLLKAALLNISSERRNSLSQISKRLTNDQKKLLANVMSKVQMSMMLGKTGNNKMKEEKEKGDQEEEKEKFFDLAIVV